MYSGVLSGARVSAHYSAQEITQAPVYLGMGNSANNQYPPPAAGPVSTVNQILANMYSTYQNSP